MTKAVYAGSFDPITYGHLNIIKRASEIFDEIVVVAGINPSKKYLFSEEERKELIEEAIREIPNAGADYFTGLLVKYVKDKEINCIIKGLRASTDFDVEFGMGLANRDLAPDIETVFLMADKDYQFISSGMIKELASFGAEVSNYVPSFVSKKIDEKLAYNLWLDALNELNLSGNEEQTFETLVKNYGDDSRKYHNFKHLLQMFNELRGVKSQLNNPNMLMVSAWFHDIVYDTESKENEEESAEIAYDFCIKSGLGNVFAEKVREMILATKHEEVPSDDDIKFFVDADLSILGEIPTKYERYTGKIRKEFSWVIEERFVEGRKEFLQNMLKRDSIYHTDFFKSRYEKRARQNLENELSKFLNN